MRVNYDFHIHSALSPCADDDMTPCNITAMAAVKELGAVCVSDHNAIANVRAAMECGEAFGVTVLPAVEVQTAEDIHVLAIFPEYGILEKFFNTLVFPDIENMPEIFGNQLILDCDNNVVGRENRYLLSGATDDIYAVCRRIIDMGGKAIPAHIDREANGILAILGAVPPDLPISRLEYSPYAGEELRARYALYGSLTDSDAHRLPDISDAVNALECEGLSPLEIFRAI